MHRYGPRSAAAVVTTALLLALGLATGTAATAVDRPTKPRELTLINTASGAALADEKGNPLYLRKADKPDVSGCTGTCAKTWPAAVGFPTKARGVTGDTGQTKRLVPGTRLPQVIYDQHPLYYYRNDEPKHPQGQHVAGFSLIAPDGSPLPAAEPGTGETISSTSRPESEVTGKATGRATATKTPGHTATARRTATSSATASRRPTATPRPTATSSRTPSATRSTMSSSGIASGAATGVTSGVATGIASGVASGVASPLGSGSPAVGAVQVTPSGAARGGADHPAEAADASGPTGPAELSLAIGATAAAGAGALLVIRRLQRRAARGDH